MKKSQPFNIIYHSPSFSMSLVQQPLQPLVSSQRIRHISYSQQFNPSRFLARSLKKKDPSLSFQ